MPFFFSLLLEIEPLVYVVCVLGVGVTATTRKQPEVDLPQPQGINPSEDVRWRNPQTAQRRLSSRGPRYPWKEGSSGRHHTRAQNILNKV